MDETKQKQPRKSSGKNCRKHTTTKTNIILNLYLSVNRSKMCSVLTLLQHSTPKIKVTELNAYLYVTHV